MVAVGDKTYAADSYDNRPHVLVSLTKSLNNNTVTTLDIGSVIYNVGGIYTSGSSFTIPEDGIYELGLVVRYATNATGVRQARCTVGGTSGYHYEEKNALSGQNTAMSWVFEDELASATVITFDGFQTSGGALSLTSLNRAWVRQLVAT